MKILQILSRVNGENSVSTMLANAITEKLNRIPEIKVYEHRNAPVGNDMIYWLDKCTIKAIDSEGIAIHMKGDSVNIMLKNVDGIWLWLDDNSFAALFFAV